MTNINDLPTVYNPQETEDKIYKFWEENDCFKADETSDKPPYSIVIPPPNVTGVLHIGHALDNTLQDILIRYHRMSGYEALWVPGKIGRASVGKECVRRCRSRWSPYH